MKKLLFILAIFAPNQCFNAAASTLSVPAQRPKPYLQSIFATSIYNPTSQILARRAREKIKYVKFTIFPSTIGDLQDHWNFGVHIYYDLTCDNYCIIDIPLPVRAAGLEQKMESLGITIANNLGLKNFKVVGTHTKELRTGRKRDHTHRPPDPAARSLKRKDLENHFVVAHAFVQNLFQNDRQLYVTSDELPNCELLCMDFLWGRFKPDNPHSQDSEQMPQTAAQEEKSFLTPAEDTELPESSSFAVPAPLAALAQSMARLTNSLANASVSFSLMAQPGFLPPQPSVAPHAQPFDHRHPYMPSYPGYSPAPMKPSAPLNPRAVPFEPTKFQSS